MKKVIPILDADRFSRAVQAAHIFLENLPAKEPQMDTMHYAERKRKALVVGDSFFVGSLFGDFFQKHGYQLASVGSEADEIAAGIRFEPDIVVVDFEMGHNDPYLVIALLHNALPESCIALINGHRVRCNEMEAKLAGARKILSRGCDVSVFEDVIHAADEEVYL